MTDNTKVGRILVSQISVGQRFRKDLYYSNFFLHPRDIPISPEDKVAFEFWKIPELWGRDDDEFVADSIAQEDSRDMQRAQELYQKIYDFVSSSYQTVSRQDHFPAGEPLNTVKQFIADIQEMGFFILRFQELQVEGNYIEIHSVNSFILTVALASTAKMPQYRLIHLALSAMFHEVGLPKFVNLIDRDKSFTPQEFQLQKAHVQETFKLLKPYQFRSEVMKGILQHHERFDGSGYPYGITEREISDFGRYLGLVCSYVAMTVNKSFREPLLAHSAIMVLLKGANIHYDAVLVRLLVKLLSLYPVGSYVSLSNGTIGRVFRNNQDNPRLPVVQVLFDRNYDPISKTTVIQTSDKISIVQPVSYKQIVQLQKDKLD